MLHAGCSLILFLIWILFSFNFGYGNVDNELEIKPKENKFKPRLKKKNYNSISNNIKTSSSFSRRKVESDHSYCSYLANNIDQ